MHAFVKAHGPAQVFAFHGTGGDEHQFTRLVTDILPNAGIVAPRGEVNEHGANRFFRRTGEGVYDMDDLAFRVERMAAFVRQNRATDVPVYAMGYSNGANILAAMTFHHPDLFDRIALLHPLTPWQPSSQPALAGKPILITGGRRDPICPPELTQSLAQYYTAQGAALTLHWHDGGHELRHEEVAALRTAFNGDPK